MGGNPKARVMGHLMVLAIFATPLADAEDLRSAQPVAAISSLAPASLASQSLLISSISINNGNVFDLEDPEENKALYRLANRLHVTTRDHVIAQQLLFTAGEPLSPQALQESERILRANRYIQNASIQPTANADGTVAIDVQTSDTWTLMPKISLSRSGGKNSSSIGLREMNLFGSGASLEAFFKSDVDRDHRTLRYKDQNIGDTWYGITAVLESNTDGHARGLEIEKPFYSLQSHDARGFAFFDSDEQGHFYDAGEIIGEYNKSTRSFDAYTGWSRGLENGWSKRWKLGVAYEDTNFDRANDSVYTNAIPANRRLAYPYVGFELVQDNFETTENMNQLNQTEDVFLGTHFSARLGYAASGFGSDRDAMIFRVTAEKGFGSTASRALLLQSEMLGRFEGGGQSPVALSAGANYYKRQSEHRLFHASLRGRWGNALDADQYFELGGDNGLRGYPLRYQTGDKLAILSLEQRYFTDWYPWRLFRVGGAVFFDVGRAWGDSPAGRTEDRLLSDVGFGLRIGSARSGLGRMTHIDVAFPLDGSNRAGDVQFLVSTHKGF